MYTYIYTHERVMKLRYVTNYLCLYGYIINMYIYIYIYIYMCVCVLL